ncbi:hypothetical protein CsSME_00017482 [Camellia sinensis var. sinensis]
MMKESDDLSKLTQTIGEIIEEGVKKTESMPSPCIFRVPEELRKVKESAYTPQLVSIGPLHSNKQHIKSPMEDIKKHYTKVLFKRVKAANKTTDIMSLLKNCVEKMKLSLDRARDCYAVKIEVDALEDVEKMKESLDKAEECKLFAEKVDALDVTMLVIDGCFILELLYRCPGTGSMLGASS